jgi:large subunit ribosomal protein L21
MYAIVDILGQQFKVEKGQTLFVHRLEGEEGSAVEFGKVLLLSDDSNAVKVSGLGNALVKATILNHLKGDKVIVFKKKRRKGYRKKNGHRQYLTKIQVQDILS